METILAKAKTWGNSVGIILPKELGIRPNDEILVKISKARQHGKVKDAWGLFKNTGNTKAILDELNEELN